jgi:hypothetical protein
MDKIFIAKITNDSLTCGMDDSHLCRKALDCKECKVGISQKDLVDIITQAIYSYYEDYSDRGIDRAKGSAYEVLKAILEQTNE